MQQAALRRMFPGNNTNVGFFSYYHYILPQQQANHIFCLKGGPGVGKSTFMKNIGSAVSEKGFDMEYLHCSSDPDSLDGIVIPQLQVAMIDGTAPHVIDPVNPGAVDEIINLGEYWDACAIKQNKDQIIQTTAHISRLFRRAYQYIAAAKSVFDALTTLIQTATDAAGAAMESEKIISAEIGGHVTGKPGRERKMFASAITPQGIVQHVETLFDGTYKVYGIDSLKGVGVSEMLKRVAQEAQIRGFDTELYYCPLAPAERIEHVIIPQLKLALITQNEYININSKPQTVVDLKQYTRQSLIEGGKDAMETDAQLFGRLLKEAVSVLAEAKGTHDVLEQYYVPHMDFNKTNDKAQKICDVVLSYADNLKICE